MRGVARTAVVAGTATAVSGRVQRRQAERFAARDQQIAANRGAGYYEGQQMAAAEYAPPPPPPPAASPPAASRDDMLQQLRELGELRDQGVLTEAEFAAEKAKVLASG
jgi:hypothetical protein